MNLSTECINKISLGFNWNPDMSFDEFCLKNKRVSLEERWKLFNEIEGRYLEKTYENK